ncbi:MAG TPA: hypothetical protein VGD88_03085 [Opitutaceae bacterium]
MSDSESIPTQSVQGAPSWRLASDVVEAFITCKAGHLAPVTFQTARGPVQPFAVAPWAPAGETLPAGTPGLLTSLRGDFFCLPFGGNGKPWHGERHPPHGETAGTPWTALESTVVGNRSRFVAELKPKVRAGRVVKTIELKAGETNVYCRHEVTGFAGRTSLGHHALLEIPEGGVGSVALSPWHQGRVCPLPFEEPANRGYSTLKTGAKFTRLNKVPLATGGTTDVSQFPAHDGFDDLVMVSSKADEAFAWSTVTVATHGYLWFSLRDPRVLASTILWQSHGGRHYAPWSGRHRRVLGVEDVTSYFHFGLAESAGPNPLSAAGVPTAIALRPNKTFAVNYVMGIAALPRRFDRVKKIEPREGHLLITPESGTVIEHPIDLTFFK